MTVQKLLLRGSYEVTNLAGNGKVWSFPTQFLTDALPDLETTLFFAKVYELKPADTVKIIQLTCPGPVVEALTNEAGLHSQTLQDFLVESYQVDGEWFYPDLAFIEAVPGAAAPVQAELLPEMWKQLELEVAKSIKEVAETLAATIGHLPGRTGHMTFKSMAALNARRPVIGDYKAQITHERIKRVLVVFDVSGSVSKDTVKTIVDDVVGLAYEANAALAIVSDSAFFYEPGAFSTQQVLEDAEYRGTRYEMLVPLFQDRDWDVVVTIADYDSSYSAKEALERCSGRIDTLLDVSLVNRSTFLAECLAHMADKVRPLLIASDRARLC